MDMMDEHKWKYCSWCDMMMVVCASCGNNGCNAGKGYIDGEPCPDCDEAHKKMREAYENDTVPSKPDDWKERHEETHKKFNEQFL